LPDVEEGNTATESKKHEKLGGENYPDLKSTTINISKGLGLTPRGKEILSQSWDLVTISFAHPAVSPPLALARGRQINATTGSTRQK
jgi:hypothetical protein